MLIKNNLILEFEFEFDSYILFSICQSPRTITNIHILPISITYSFILRNTTRSVKNYKKKRRLTFFTMHLFTELIHTTGQFNINNGIKMRRYLTQLFS